MDLEAMAQSFWVDFGAKGHGGLHRFESWSAERDTSKHEPRPAVSGSILELADRLVALSKVVYPPHGRSIGFV